MISLDEFRPKRGGVSKVDLILASMPDGDAEVARQALAGPQDEFPNSTLARVLTRMGWPVSPSAIRRWRDLNCG